MAGPYLAMQDYRCPRKGWYLSLSTIYKSPPWILNAPCHNLFCAVEGISLLTMNCRIHCMGFLKSCRGFCGQFLCLTTACKRPAPPPLQCIWSTPPCDNFDHWWWKVPSLNNRPCMWLLTHLLIWFEWRATRRAIIRHVRAALRSPTHVFQRSINYINGSKSGENERLCAPDGTASALWPRTWSVYHWKHSMQGVRLISLIPVTFCLGLQWLGLRPTR